NSHARLARCRPQAVAVARDQAVTPILQLLQTRNVIETAQDAIEEVSRTRQEGHHRIDGAGGAARAEHLTGGGEFDEDRRVAAVLIADAGALAEIHGGLARLKAHPRLRPAPHRPLAPTLTKAAIGVVEEDEVGGVRGHPRNSRPLTIYLERCRG